jgi:hypothetical protein
MKRVLVAPALLAIALFAVAGGYAIPRGLEARSLLEIEHDPSRIADRALDGLFSADVAAREIDRALAADDADLAESFLQLARERGVVLDPAQIAKVDATVAAAGSAQRVATSFALGFASGEANDMAAFAGTALGDLFVIGDIRDAIREGARLAAGEAADELVLGLAGVGLAITVGTYTSLGAAAPARIGVSLAKAARKTGRLGGDLAGHIGGILRRTVDWGRLRTAVANTSIAEPAAAIRGARAAVKLERAGGLIRLARDTGRVQRKAGTQAALDGLKIAETPGEMSRLARLADAKGGKTRAIVKLVGRGAIALTIAAFDLGLWIFGALLTVFGLVSSLKAAAERLTLRAIHRSKARRLAEQQRRFAALIARR